MIMLEVAMKTTIKTLYQKGYNKTQIGRMLGIDRKMVGRVLKTDTEDGTFFQMTLYNLNYGTAVNASNVSIGEENVAIDPVHIAIEGLIASLVTIEKAKAFFASMENDSIFGRSDIAAITTKNFLATMPEGRFEFVLTPKHGS